MGFSQAQTNPEAVRFFEEKVRPLLTAKCLTCHNEQARMSGLSLESRESALLGGSRGSAVIPRATGGESPCAGDQPDGRPENATHRTSRKS